jgi:hypothetical protein
MGDEDDQILLAVLVHSQQGPAPKMDWESLTAVTLSPHPCAVWYNRALLKSPTDRAFKTSCEAFTTRPPVPLVKPFAIAGLTHVSPTLLVLNTIQLQTRT